MRKIFTLTVLGLLVATPVLAATCPEGEVWQPNISYENGECTQEVQTHSGVQLGVPNALVCALVPFGQWWNGKCYLGGSVQTQCVSYEQVEVDNGMCVPVDEDPVEPEEPIEEEIPQPKKIIGGHFFSMNLPRIMNDSVVTWQDGDNTHIAFRTNKFMSCGVIFDRESQEFAVNTDGLPVAGNGWEMLGSVDGNFGYAGQRSFDTQPVTFREIVVELGKGSWFVRPICDHFGKTIVGTEFEVSVK